MLNNFFDDEETATHIKIDMSLYENILSDRQKFAIHK